MASPMANEVIEKVHQLAFAAEKYEDIVFMDMNGNILTDQRVKDIDEDMDT